jgi:NAD(P)-dependent dehydrogenase (short-subunit alcohol dehydrogenase family)
VARTRDALDETRDIIVTAVPGTDVLVLTADVRDMESVRAAVQSALRHFGKLDILIANAGAITAFTPCEDHSQTGPSFLCLTGNSLFVFILAKLWTRKILMRGGTPLRSTSVGSLTLSGIHSL